MSTFRGIDGLASLEARVHEIIGKKCKVYHAPNDERLRQTSGTITAIRISWMQVETRRLLVLTIARKDIRSLCDNQPLRRRDTVVIAPHEYGVMPGCWEIRVHEYYGRLDVRGWIDDFDIAINTPRIQAKRKADFKSRQRSKTVAAQRESARREEERQMEVYAQTQRLIDLGILPVCDQYSSW